MPFSIDDKHLIKVLREEKQYTACEFLREFLNKKWSCGSLNHLLEKKIDKFGCVECRAGSGRPRSMRNAENIESVHSQEDRPHNHHSVRQISHEAHISRSSVHNIIKKGLQMKCLKRCKAQELTEANKVARRHRSKQLLRNIPLTL